MLFILSSGLLIPLLGKGAGCRLSIAVCLPPVISLLRKLRKIHPDDTSAPETDEKYNKPRRGDIGNSCTRKSPEGRYSHNQGCNPRKLQLCRHAGPE